MEQMQLLGVLLLLTGVSIKLVIQKLTLIQMMPLLTGYHLPNLKKKDLMLN